MNELIKLILFDLDGVLIDAKTIHFEALNECLDEEYNIRYQKKNIYHYMTD